MPVLLKFKKGKVQVIISTVVAIITIVPTMIQPAVFIKFIFLI